VVTEEVPKTHYFETTVSTSYMNSTVDPSVHIYYGFVSPYDARCSLGQCTHERDAAYNVGLYQNCVNSSHEVGTWVDSDRNMKSIHITTSVTSHPKAEKYIIAVTPRQLIAHNGTTTSFKLQHGAVFTKWDGVSCTVPTSIAYQDARCPPVTKAKRTTPTALIAVVSLLSVALIGTLSGGAWWWRRRRMMTTTTSTTSTQYHRMEDSAGGDSVPGTYHDWAEV
jgi:hypothetical protein